MNNGKEKLQVFSRSTAVLRSGSVVEMPWAINSVRGEPASITPLTENKKNIHVYQAESVLLVLSVITCIIVIQKTMQE